MRYWTILHQTLPNGQKGKTKSVAVNGMQNMTKRRSATARLMMRMLVVDLMPGFAATTMTTRVFPINPRMPIIPKKTGTITRTIFSMRSRSQPISSNSRCLQFSISVPLQMLRFDSFVKFEIPMSQVVSILIPNFFFVREAKGKEEKQREGIDK